MRLYVYASQAPMSCIMCICMCMSDTFNPHTCRYKQICTLRLLGTLYMYVSVLYHMHVCMYIGYIKPSYMQTHKYMHSSGEFMSVCIFSMNTSRYAFRVFHSCTYARLKQVHIQCISVHIRLYLHHMQAAFVLNSPNGPSSIRRHTQADPPARAAAASAAEAACSSAGVPVPPAAGPASASPLDPPSKSLMIFSDSDSLVSAQPRALLGLAAR
jgi:hypothetical protein